MTKENKFKIGLCLQGIALSMDDITLKANEDRLKMIEDIIAEEEQEPCEDLYLKGHVQGVENTAKEFKYEYDRIKCSDVISRQAVLEALYELKDIPKLNTGYVMDSIRKIRNLPSVTPQEPKTGEWIADVDGYTCSECGVFNTDDDNFCPNCGADMRGEEDEKR